jgi:hypothetical protein
MLSLTAATLLLHRIRAAAHIYPSSVSFRRAKRRGVTAADLDFGCCDLENGRAPFAPNRKAPARTGLAAALIKRFIFGPRDHSPNLFRDKNTKNRKTSPDRVGEEIAHSGVPRR